MKRLFLLSLVISLSISFAVWLSGYLQEDLPDTVQQNDCDRIAQQFSDESLARYARMACLQQVAEEQGRELLEMFKK